MVMRQITAVVMMMAHIGALIEGRTENDELCGLPAPDPDKTCVSVRLPWNPNPVYFCVEKGNFKYRSNCHGRSGSWSFCGASDLRHDTLLVATPWDCCPIESDPDNCANGHHQCPPSPHNRTCTVVDPHDPWECCGGYFCEENATPESCHFKRLDPSCTEAPKGKENCVAFIDPHGCCPKFQCTGEGRPGHCPAEVAATKYMTRLYTSSSESTTDNVGNAATKDSVTAPAGPLALPDPIESEAGEMSGRKFGAHVYHYHIGPTHNPEIACVGDFNCPGTMKCCSHDMKVYIADGKYASRNKNPVNGYCMEPASNATESIKPVFNRRLKYLT